jgi:hypothetical protein
MRITSGIHCPTGYASEGGANDYSCNSKLSADSFTAYEYQRGVDSACPMGDLTETDHNTNNVVTHYISMQTQNENAMC